MDKVIEYIPTQSISVIDSVNLHQVQSTMQKITQFQKVIQQTLHKEHDYGVIPGSIKPTLLKPGAEKILMMMGLRSEFEIVDSTRDFEQGFFQYQVRCKLFKNDVLITEGLGACNTREKKYKGQDACSIDNTVLKMAKKRALIDATLLVASLSDVFTQDIEDMEDFEGNTVRENKEIKRDIKTASSSQINFIKSLKKKMNLDDEKFNEMIKRYNVTAIEQLTVNDASALIKEMQELQGE